MELLDFRMLGPTSNSSRILKKYKGFQGTVKSINVQPLIVSHLATAPKELCVATCGLDRILRIHNIKTSQLVQKIYLKSRLNCLLFSKHDAKKKTKVNDDESNDLDEDQLSLINSEDCATDTLWSDIETINEEYPLTMKRKIDERLKDFNSDTESLHNDENNNKKNDLVFKKPKYVKI
jgi:hypothetical protein